MKRGQSERCHCASDAPESCIARLGVDSSILLVELAERFARFLDVGQGQPAGFDQV
jgi:hypothetical protein